jgi:tetratricopeptide (TPR) repeat protein
MTDAAVSWEPGGVLLGEWDVEAHLGSGGMGHVVRARSRSTGQVMAVKRAQATSPEARASLLAELRTWFDLPSFPHVVACGFWQTIGEDVAIFAEYVEGGSLDEWIAERRLRGLTGILDVAIQLAWGLHAAHLCGVVHRDVKPGNVLLTHDGVVKIGDFGLASAARQQVAGSVALTRGYCSPEQAELGRGRDVVLTPATDQWSWGVTVLEMFTGTPPCRFGGQLAATVLESFLAQGAQEPPLPRMPDLLAEVLRKCFQHRLADRWGSLAEVAVVVAVVYQLALSEPYPRPRPDWPTPGVNQERSRRTLGGAEWDDPVVWLRRVLREAGEDIALADAFTTARGGSRRVQAIADLVPYDEALRKLTRLVSQGRADLTPLLAELCLSKALAHWAAADVPGTARLAEHAAGLLEERQDAQPSLLVEAYLRGALCARVLGRLPDALQLATRALVVCERAGAPEERRLGPSYLYACASQARTFHLLEDYPAALATLERARTMAEKLVALDGRADLEGQRAELYLQTAQVLKDAGEPDAATAWLDRAVPLLERLVHQEGDRGLIHTLASAYLTRARLLSLRDELTAASQDCARSLTLWRDLVESDDRPELMADLADVSALQGNLLVRQDRPVEALPLYDRARAIYERLVGPLGQHEHIPGLVRACLGQAIATLNANNPPQALPLCARALSLLEPLVSGARPDLASDLAWAQSIQAQAQLALGQDEAGLASLRTAVVLYEELVQGRGRWDLLLALLRAYRTETLALTERGRSRTALERLDHALLVGQGLIEARETETLLQALFALRIDRAALLVTDGQIARAQAELCELMLRLEHLPGADEPRQRALRLLGTLW